MAGAVPCRCHKGAILASTGCVPATRQTMRKGRMACGGDNPAYARIPSPLQLPGLPFVDRGHNVAQYSTWQAQQITATKLSVKRKWVCLLIELDQARWEGRKGIRRRANREVQWSRMKVTHRQINLKEHKHGLRVHWGGFNNSVGDLKSTESKG